ncbi:MAG TPA: 6-phosphogluconolactonase [Terriglobales bacterium]|nr:6-phosphogluconolactonase [Terriglobales bacterium]
MNKQVRIFEDLQHVAEAAADEFTARAQQAIARNRRFTVALAGGSTPKTMYSILAQRSAKKPDELDWKQIQVFFGDERHVPPTDPDSNFRMANETLLSKVPLPASNIHRIHCEEPDANVAAEQYDRELVSSFALTGDEMPRFDLILLGMGPDGHTASLFPGTAAVQELSKRVVANWVPKLKTWRVTFTRPVLNQAECVLLMVCGAEKASALKQVMGDGSPEEFPVKYVAAGEVNWFVDKQAISN